MLRRLAVAVALCLGCISGPLLALGLGAIRVESGLNQPFAATIPFTALSPQERESLRVRIADNADFAHAGIERSAYLSSVTIEALTGDGAPRLVIRAGQIAREPMLTLLIDVRAGGPKVLREYTVFLDPPGTAPFQGTPATTVTAEPAQPEEQRAADIPAAKSTEPGSEDQTQAQGQYGPIDTGESLWGIAARLRPDDRRITVEQVVLALYNANPAAFVAGNINSMIRSSILRVPSAQEMASIKPAEAKAMLGTLAATSKPLAPPSRETSAPVESAGASESDTDVADAGATTPEPVAESPTEATVPAPATDPVSPKPANAGPSADTPPVASRFVLPAASTAEGSLMRTLMPALIVLIVLLVAGLLLRSVRQKRAQAEYAAASKAMAAASSPAAGTAPVSRARRSPREELEEANQQLAEEDGAMGSSRTGSALVATAKMYQGKPGGERDPASSFEASTFEIDLSDNDPISEAEFHLAYGLYDEAALLLSQAAQKDPGRTELRVKLAETYFAAGKAREFQETAAGLASQLDPPSWGKLAIMGRQLCPDAELFKGDALGSTMALDLTLEESAGSDPGPSARIDDGLDFKLEELELPTRPAGRTGASPTDFDLGEFDLVDGGNGVGGGSVAAKPAAMEFADFDLGEIKLDELSAAPNPDDPFGGEAFTAGDDVATKLDLARAYVEMGDMELARSLLDEVDLQGSDDQKRDAAHLRERMLG